MKKKPELKVKMTHVNGWNADVVLMVGDFDLVRPWVNKNVQNWRKEELLKHLDDKKENPHNHNLGRTFFLGGGGSLIWLKEYAHPIAVHEMTHAAHHMLLAKATPLSDDTEEAYAYLMEHLFEALSH